MTNVIPMRKDGVPTIPLCKDCMYFHESMGIGNPAYCSTPKRRGDFDPVYGWQLRSIRAHDARADNGDCGMVGNFFQEKVKGFDDPLSLVEPMPKPTYWSRLKRWLSC